MGLQRYKCHKEVEAFKIAGIAPDGGSVSVLLAEDGDGDGIAVDEAFMAKHNPQPGGYYVRYADGYQSFSPAQAFEEGYTPLREGYILESGWPQVHGKPSSVTFFIQSGPIKEFGVNGVQIDAVIEWAKAKIEEFNKAFPCRENSMIVTKLDEALLWSIKRKLDREKRNVEGTNKA